MITETTMGKTVNLKYSHLLTLSLPTEVFLVNSQNWLAAASNAFTKATE